MLLTPYHLFNYSNISRRINKLDIKICSDNFIVNNDDNFVIALDATGIKVTNRGEWLYQKWNANKKKKKGYLKIHVAVDIKKKKILSLHVTSEQVHDSKILPKLIDDIALLNTCKSHFLLSILLSN